MIHAHPPEAARSFIKHLFSTFLGLLMALGLEGFRESRHQAHLAEQATQAIRQELQTNLVALKECNKVGKDRAKALQAFLDKLRVQAPTEADLKALETMMWVTTPDVSNSAWRSAGTPLLLHRLAFYQIQKLDYAYQIQDSITAEALNVSGPLLDRDAEVREAVLDLAASKGAASLEARTRLRRALGLTFLVQAQIANTCGESSEKCEQALAELKAP